MTPEKVSCLFMSAAIVSYVFFSFFKIVYFQMSIAQNLQVKVTLPQVKNLQKREKFYIVQQPLLARYVWPL